MAETTQLPAQELPWSFHGLELLLPVTGSQCVLASCSDDTLTHYMASTDSHNARMHSYIHEQDPRKIIEALRVARGFSSTRALALAAGMPQPTLSRYMKGDSADLEMSNWRKLAETLEVSVSELLGEVPLAGGPIGSRLLRVMEDLPEHYQTALLASAESMARSAFSAGTPVTSVTSAPTARAKKPR
jgi:transcriptional regulator with XRE-family HTH domain